MLVVLVDIEAGIRSRGEAASRQGVGVVSGVGEGLTAAASTKTLLRRGVAKRISGAATFSS